MSQESSSYDLFIFADLEPMEINFEKTSIPLYVYRNMLLHYPLCLMFQNFWLAHVWNDVIETRVQSELHGTFRLDLCPFLRILNYLHLIY